MTRSTEHDFTHGKDIDILVGDCIESMRSLPDQSVHTCVTSPPYYGLRDYGMEHQFGQEGTPEEFIQQMVEVFREVKRVLRDDGTLWVNIGDSYAGSGKGGNSKEKRSKNWQPKYGKKGFVPIGTKPKDLIGIPWMLAFALRADGWYLRQDIIWNKPNPMPEPAKDRCVKAHEFIFLLSKSRQYHFDYEAIKEPVANSSRKNYQRGKRTNGDNKDRNDNDWADRHDGEIYNNRNKRSVWEVCSKPFKDAHFAVFPPELIEPCVLAGCPKGGTVLDPFGGSGTTAGVALRHGRKAIMCELNPKYAAIMPNRIEAISGLSATQKTLLDW